MAQRPPELEAWRPFQSEFAGRDLAEEPPGLNVWLQFQPESAGSEFSRPAPASGHRCSVGPEAGRNGPATGLTNV